MEQLDEVDVQLLTMLQDDGRISHTELAQRIGLTPPTVMRRVKLLEERGFIKGYTALVDPLRLGFMVTAFIFVEIAGSHDIDELGAYLSSLPPVQEVHKVIGEWCFLLKVRTETPQALEELLNRTLRKRPEIQRTHTTLATSAPYEAPMLELSKAMPTDVTVANL